MTVPNDITAWYLELERSKEERRNRPLTRAEHHGRRQAGPSLTERLAAWPGKGQADRILDTWQRVLPYSDDASIADEVARASRIRGRR